MAVAEYDITIEQGSTFRISYTYKPTKTTVKEWTDWTGASQIRESKRSSGKLVVEFDVSIEGDDDEVVVMTLSNSDTEQLPANKSLFYDLLMTSPGGDEAIRLLEGKVLVSPQVTA